jgi:signal peptidase I
MIARDDDKFRMVAEMRRRGRTLVEITGRSMYPLLRNGVSVEVHPTAFDELQVGDLVVFSDGRGLICHRLLRKAHGTLILKGDTNLWTDPPVAYEQVLGRVRCIVENNLRIVPIDTPRHKRRAALIARFSYPYSLYFTLLHKAGHCRWWTRTD